MKKRLLILGCICAGYISIINPYHTFAAPSDSTSADEILNGARDRAATRHRSKVCAVPVRVRRPMSPPPRRSPEAAPSG